MSNLRWQQYLYEPHSKTEYADWALRLKFFRFCRAFGGHANDGDELVVAIKTESENDLHHVCAILGVTLVNLPVDNPKPIAGKSYTYEEFKKFRNPIRDFPEYDQPGHIQISNIPVFVWIELNRFEIRISDQENPYAVSEQSIRAAEQLEPTISQLQSLVIDPPRDNRNCICPKYYPEFWPA